MFYTDEQRGHPLFKKLSIGLACNITSSEILEIFQKYSYLIDSMYVSPPYTGMRDGELIKFTDKPFVNEALRTNKQYPRYVEFAVSLAKKYDIKLDLVVNSSDVGKSELELVRKIVDKYQPYEMTVMDKHLAFWLENYPDIRFVRSHNNKPLRTQHFTDLEYRGYIAAKQFMWNPQIWPNGGKQARILANNACLFTCPGCHTRKDFEDIIGKDIKAAGALEAMVARISMLPEDMVLVAQHFPNITFKLYSREKTDEMITLLSDCEQVRSSKEILSDRFSMVRWHFNNSVIVRMNAIGYDIDKILRCKEELHEYFRSRCQEITESR